MRDWVHSVQVCLAWLGLCTLCATVLAALVRLVVPETCRRLAPAWRRMPRFRRVAVMLAVMFIGSYAGSKTNSLMQMIFSPMRGLVVGEQTWEEKIASNWNVRGAWSDSYWQEGT